MVAGNFAGALLAYFGATVSLHPGTIYRIGILIPAPVYVLVVLDQRQTSRLTVTYPAPKPHTDTQVYKVEPPGKGDALRSLRLLDQSGTSLWWRAHGRNRLCMSVDLHSAEGREVIKQLSAKVFNGFESHISLCPSQDSDWGLTGL